MNVKCQVTSAKLPPRRSGHQRMLQRVAAAAVRLDAWDLPLIGPADRSDFVMVRRDRYDALARACADLLEAGV